MTRFGERLKSAMFAAGVENAEALAKLIGVTPQIVRKWMRDEKIRLSAENIVSLAEHLNVRIKWLARGTGQIHNFTVRSYTEAELIGAFRTLGKREKILVRDFIGMLMRYGEDSED